MTMQARPVEVEVWYGSALAAGVPIGGGRKSSPSREGQSARRLSQTALPIIDEGFE